MRVPSTPAINEALALKRTAMVAPVVIALVLNVVFMSLFVSAVRSQPVTAILKSWQRTYGPYVVKVTDEARKGKDYTALTIWRGKQLLFDTNGVRAWVIDAKNALECGPYSEENYNPELIDITGDGTKDLMVRTWTGGVHCCYRYCVFSLAEKFQRILDLDAGHGHLTLDRSQSGLPRIVITDSTFAYWNASFADSPQPSVAYVWNDARREMQVDLNLTRRLNKVDLQPAGKELVCLLSEHPPSYEARAPLYSRWSVPPRLIEVLVDLKYSGRSSEVADFVDSIWPPAARASKKLFLTEFDNQLAKSIMYRSCKWD